MRFAYNAPPTQYVATRVTEPDPEGPQEEGKEYVLLPSGSDLFSRGALREKSVAFPLKRYLSVAADVGGVGMLER